MGILLSSRISMQGFAAKHHGWSRRTPPCKRSSFAWEKSQPKIERWIGEPPWVKEETPISDISRSSAAPHWSPEEGRTSAKSTILHGLKKNMIWFIQKRGYTLKITHCWIVQNFFRHDNSYKFMILNWQNGGTQFSNPMKSCVCGGLEVDHVYYGRLMTSQF